VAKARLLVRLLASLLRFARGFIATLVGLFGHERFDFLCPNSPARGVLPFPAAGLMTFPKCTTVLGRNVIGIVGSCRRLLEGQHDGSPIVGNSPVLGDTGKLPALTATADDGECLSLGWSEAIDSGDLQRAIQRNGSADY